MDQKNKIATKSNRRSEKENKTTIRTRNQNKSCVKAIDERIHKQDKPHEGQGWTRRGSEPKEAAEQDREPRRGGAAAPNRG